jgi:choice-of-anchor B domain-containing protein
MKKIAFILLLFTFVCTKAVDSYNVTYLGNKTYPGQQLGSIWGYTDTIKNKDYALVGASKGLSIVDITNAPILNQVTFDTTSNTIWHEIKTYKNYAYVVHDGNNRRDEGLVIVDLSHLPDSTKRYNYKGNGSNIVLTTQHTVYIDDSGFLYLNGGGVVINGITIRGTAIFDLKTDPLNPVYIGNVNNRYVHDCYVRENKLYVSQVDQGYLGIYDISNKATPQFITEFQTPYFFTHNSWLSDDSKTLFTTDEKPNAPIGVYDISDLNNIIDLPTFKNLPDESAIAHNVHVWNDYLVVPYYTRGLIIFDASIPDNVIRIGYYDTSPQYTGSTFNGAWGAYPYFNNGKVIVSDIEKGLYVLQPTYIRAARLQGTVRDTNTLQTLVGVKISFVDTTINATTTIDGIYKTGTPRAGTFNFKAEKTGYITKFFRATLVNGQITIVDLKLRQIPVYSSNAVRNCGITSYTLPSGTVVTKSGVYISTIILPSGKDSIITSTVSISTTSSISSSFCQGRNFRLPSGKTVTTAGIYRDTIRNSSGCDSIMTINLSQISNSTFTQAFAICQGDSVRLPNGQYAHSNNTFVNTLTNAKGCDSIITTSVTTLPVYNITLKDSVYVPNSYTLPNGTVVNTAGNYVSNLDTRFGCDSIVTIQLKVIDTTTISGIKNNKNQFDILYTVQNNVINIIQKTNIHLNKLIIYNSIGIKVLDVDKPSNTVYLPNLPKDIYIIEAISSSNEYSIQKILIY